MRDPQHDVATPVIEVRGLVKDYGRFRALDQLDLEVADNEVYGFIGPNGAGKSTTIRVLMDLLRPTSGLVTVFGLAPAVGGTALRARIGYLPGELAMASAATARELLNHLADLRGGRGHTQIAELAERLRLDLDRPVRALSKGNKQKVGVVQAVMHAPSLLILDEPTSGLDPLLQRVVLDIIREQAERGATVLMSSHLLHEVESVANRVAILREGRMVAVDSVQRLRERAGQRVELQFAAAPDVAAFTGLAHVHDLELAGTTLRCVVHGEPDALLKVAAKYHVTAWSARHRDLEELFLSTYQGGKA